LPEARSLGTWRLDTSSENAQKEIPGMVQVVEGAQGHGLHWAVLRIEHRASPGRRFTVPVLDIDHTMQELADGATRLAALPTPERPALPASHDDIVIDAEIVTSDIITGEHVVDPVLADAWAAAQSQHQRNQILPRARKVAEQLGEPIPDRWEDITTLVADHLMAENGAT
jgi:hypothetical protein